MLKRYFILLTAVAALISAWGCNDRGTNVPNFPVDRWEIYPRGDHVFDTLLALQIRNESQLLLTSTYIPKVALPRYGSQPVPTLVLLAPEEEDKFFYFNHGLLELLQEMILSGEIQPMVVCCVGNDRVFGGYWYGNSAPAGYYDGIIGAPPVNLSQLLGWLHNSIPATINLSSKRGIGGVGTAAYGAFRAILRNPGVYKSISVTDGPLDFDGADGNSGLIPLFKVAMAEQAAFRHPDRDTIFFDSLALSPISRILLGGAFAFSPKDTGVTFTYTPVIRHLSNPTRDTSYVTIQIASRRSILDDTTLVKNLVVSGRTYHLFDPIMPFYIDTLHAPNLPGDIYPPIWSLWLANSPDSLYARAGANPLDSVNMFFATSPQSPHNYYPMTQSWITTLKEKGLSSQITEYDHSGVNGAPVGDGEYMYDLLRTMLKFHSDNFGR
jgi:hypothetical protein